MNEQLIQEWVWGWDTKPGIVSVWAEPEGRAHVWRRMGRDTPLIHEVATYRPWALLPAIDDLEHLGARLAPAQDDPAAPFTFTRLDGPGALRYLVAARDARALEAAILAGASRRLGRTVSRMAELDAEDALWLPLDEQYLVASGRTCFREIDFETPLRLQCDLETTGLDPARDRIFLIALRTNRGQAFTMDAREGGLMGDAAEADLLRRFADRVRAIDPDVIENHNLLGFDLPFLARRAERLGMALVLGRLPRPPLEWRGEAAPSEDDDEAAADEEPRQAANRPYRRRLWRPRIPGRELIDTLTAVRRYDFVTRDLPAHNLKAVARYFGLAPPDRTYLEGAQIFATWRRDPETVRRYALDDVAEAAGIARLLGGSAFALARMAPRRYERIAEAGPATGILDPLLVRAYLRAGQALPGYALHDGTMHTGAALYLFASGVARHVIKADVSSLYPSLMRQYRIGPRGDHLGVLLALVDQLVGQRLMAKAEARANPPGSAERHTAEALSGAFKILVNSAYGYCGAVGLTRCADVHAANEITRRGRELLLHLCREFAARGATLLEADTDGVFLAVPDDWSEADERRLVAEVGATLPEMIKLDFEGRYAAMLSHEPKNYALRHYDGTLVLRGVAFRSIRFEPFGQEFLRRAVDALLDGDVARVRAIHQETLAAIRERRWTADQFAIRARLKKSPAQYHATRAARRDGAYEALIQAGRTRWQAGDIIHFYRTPTGFHLCEDPSDSGRSDAAGGSSASRDYDISYYLRLLRETYVARLERAFAPDDFATLFAANGQASLFAPPLEAIQPILHIYPQALEREA